MQRTSSASFTPSAVWVDAGSADPDFGMVDVRPFHLVLANPPYIRSEEVPRLDRSVREYEPAGALDGGLRAPAFCGTAPDRGVMSLTMLRFLAAMFTASPWHRR